MDTLRENLDREDYHVKVTVKLDDSEIENIPCKIFLPERIHEEPFVILKPTKDQVYEIMGSHRVGLSAIANDFDKSRKLYIEASEVFSLKNFVKEWGSGIYDGTLQGVPQNLHVIQHLNPKSNKKSNNITYLIFWISQNELLSPSMTQTITGTGDLKYERMNNKIFVLKNGINLFFDKHFRSKKLENDDLVQWSFLVACAECEIPSSDLTSLKNNILPDIDDFLLVASFASRKRTVCLGWTASNSDSISKFYRGNYVFPDTGGDKDSTYEIDKGLVDIKDFEKFVQTCYSEFLKFDNKKALRSALHSGSSENRVPMIKKSLDRP